MPSAGAFFSPDWPRPDNVKVCITRRSGGRSTGCFQGFNLAFHVGDNPEIVQGHRAELKSQLGVDSIQWLEQIHGTKVVEARADERTRTADGCFSRSPSLACAVMTADCLPVLICDQSGSQVAAVHAGWRGLANGIIEQAINQFSVSGEELSVYLGPAISQSYFEVGVDVLEAFFDMAKTSEQLESITQAFKPSSSKAMKYQADIYALARAELQMLGVSEIYGGKECTYSEPEGYYSYRRDGETGRMASLIWLEPNG